MENMDKCGCFSHSFSFAGSFLTPYEFHRNHDETETFEHFFFSNDFLAHVHCPAAFLVSNFSINPATTLPFPALKSVGSDIEECHFHITESQIDIVNYVRKINRSTLSWTVERPTPPPEK